MVAICATFIMALQCACLQVAFADGRYATGSSTVAIHETGHAMSPLDHYSTLGAEAYGCCCSGAAGP